MASFWPETLDVHVADSFLTDCQSPNNPSPPIGSGKKPRPGLLVIPDFDPPPPTPEPLFYFQLPQLPLAKPAKKQPRKAQALPQKQKRRKPKVWDLLPSPEATEAMPRAPPSNATATGSSLWGMVQSLWQLPAEQSQAQQQQSVLQQKKKSPTVTELLQQILESRLVQPTMSREPELCVACPPQFQSFPQARSPNTRTSLGCGVGASSLWNALMDLVTSPSPSPTQPNDSPSCPECANCLECSSSASSIADSASLCSPRYSQQPPLLSVEVALPPKVPVSASELIRARVMGARAKGKGNVPRGSPMSVLTPMSDAKSSAEPSPPNLLAFLERDTSPLRI